MVRRVLTIAIVAVLAQALVIGAAFAQDFASLVSQASAANNTWVSQINAALQATDLVTLKADAATAQATGGQVQSLLQAALPLAPDDASRSRVQGVLTHVMAALQSGQRVATDADLSAARSDLNAERGEAQEALNELAPVATQVSPPAAPVTLPQSGGVPVLPVVVVGLGSLLAGLGARRLA